MRLHGFSVSRPVAQQIPSYRSPGSSAGKKQVAIVSCLTIRLGYPFGHADCSRRADQTAEVTAYALGSEDAGFSVLAESDGLVSSIPA